MQRRERTYQWEMILPCFSHTNHVTPNKKKRVLLFAGPKEKERQSFVERSTKRELTLLKPKEREE
jgi:hypothetical protein